MPASPGLQLRTERQLSSRLAGIAHYEYDGELLDAISVEKSGFKGMRLLIDDGLVTNALRGALRFPVGARNMIPLRRLNHSPYPGRIDTGFQDLLWMVTEDRGQWKNLRNRAASRLRWSAGDAEEFVHAAATQVVFHECDAILTHLGFHS